MRRCRWAAMVVAAMVTVGCHPSAPRVGPGDDDVAADSLFTAEHLDPAEGVNPDTANEMLSEVEQERNAAAPSRAARRRRSKYPRWRITAVDGYRNDLSAVVEITDRFACGVRLCEDSKLGYLRFGGIGPIRAVHIGRLNARFGERMILGRGLGTFPVASSSAVSSGLAVSPSLSRWFGRNGAGVEIGGGPFALNVLAVGQQGSESDGIATTTPSAMWVTLCGGVKTFRSGVTWGGAGAGQGWVPAVVSVFARCRQRAFGGSGEIARYPGTPPFVALRFSDESRDRLLRWKLLAFRAPYFSSVADPMTGFDTPDRIDQGARLDVTIGPPARRVAASVLEGRTTSPGERKPYRRVLLTVAGRYRGSTEWRCAFYRLDERHRQMPDGGVSRAPEESTTSETRLRFGLRLEPHPFLSHRLRLEYATGRRRGPDGVLLSLGSRVSTPRVELVWQVSAYSITPGGRGYLTRPGVGGFESLAAVYGNGSDIAARLRYQLGGGLTLVIYHGAVWGRQYRTYVGVDWRG